MGIETTFEGASTLEVLKLALRNESLRIDAWEVCQATISSNSEFRTIGCWVIKRHCAAQISCNSEAAATHAFGPWIILLVRTTAIGCNTIAAAISARCNHVEEFLG